jgi:hypothetical protein
MKDEMGVAYSTHGRDEVFMHIFWSGDLKGRYYTQDTGRSILLKLMIFFGVDWSVLSRDRDEWRALLRAVMKLWMPCKVMNYVSS